MKRWLAALLPLLLLAPAAWGAPRRATTLYLDGAVVEERITAQAGRVDVRLPAHMQPGSLRIRPSAGSMIKEVNVVPVRPAKNHGKEVARLTERKEQLADRLKGLETREEIFRAAAKSQSGKAPRRTKNNPEPLVAIRQGTNLALGQLEEVYRQQRLARKELAGIESRLAALGEGSGSQESVAHVLFSGKGKDAVVSYIRTDLAWTLRYDFRLDDGGTVNITIRPLIPPLSDTATVHLRLARLIDGVADKPMPGTHLPQETIRLPVQRAEYHGGPGSSLVFALSNTGTYPLPPGDAASYWQGEYLGTKPFPGCLPGATCEVAAGGIFPAVPLASP